jgi:branched-chain amino acid aminotransferase
VTLQYHVNGALVPADEAAVSVRDRGFRYGDAAFETLRAYGGRIFEWDAHRARLEATCETLGMPDAPPADLYDRVTATLEANDLADAYVRVSVTRGVQPGALTPRPDVDPGVVVLVDSLPRGGTDGTPVWDGPAALRTVQTRRAPSSALPADAKTHNYLGGVLARLELRGTDADEALLLDADGHLAEGATSNVFHVVDGTVYTPSLDGPVLPGVTRRVVLECAREAGIPVETGQYDPGDLRPADEVFLTNTTWELRPVGHLDGEPLDGETPVRDRLAALYDRRVDRCYDRET